MKSRGLKVKTGIRAPAPIVQWPDGTVRVLATLGDFKDRQAAREMTRVLNARPSVPPGCTSGYAERTADKLTIELLRAYNLADGREARVFDATQVARTWVRRLLQDAEQIAAAEGTQGAARLRAMGGDS